MRLVAMLLWSVAALALLFPMLRGVAALAILRRPRLPISGRDELVKDPVCQTYVARSRAVSRGHGDDIRFFCSVECARRYAGG